MENNTAKTETQALGENKRAIIDQIIAENQGRPGAMMVVLNEIQSKIGNLPGNFLGLTSDILKWIGFSGIQPEDFRPKPHSSSTNIR
jgi:hypothetical protein